MSVRCDICGKGGGERYGLRRQWREEGIRYAVRAGGLDICRRCIATKATRGQKKPWDLAREDVKAEP